jgi:hypothetical protein
MPKSEYLEENQRKPKTVKILAHGLLSAAEPQPKGRKHHAKTQRAKNAKKSNDSGFWKKCSLRPWPFASLREESCSKNKKLTDSSTDRNGLSFIPLILDPLLSA